MSKSISELLKNKRQATADRRMGAKNAYKFKGGVTTIRILPGWRKDGDPTFSHPFGQTFIKDMDGKVMAVIGDKRLTYGEDDVVRNLIQSAKGEAATDAQREHYNDMLAKQRELVNALVLDDREADPNMPQVVDFSETQFDQILEQIELNGIAEEFLDLENGFNLKVSKSGTGFNTKYTFSFDRKPSAINSSVLENLVDIDAYIRSKFQDTERAVNAIKALTQGVSMTPKALDYSGSDDIADGEFNAVEEARAPREDDTTTVNASATDIDNLFDND